MKEAEYMNSDQREAVLTCLRLLSDNCDGAHELDHRGFNQCDSMFGKSLAEQTCLSYRQALAARKMLRKYHRQLGEDLMKQMGKAQSWGGGG